MEFRLFYRGPLKANGDKVHKHELRQKFHPQLRRLWEVTPVKDSYPLFPIEEHMRHDHKVGNTIFVPLVTKSLDLVAQLEIVMLRPEEPGAIITKGGDLDNRLKTLFDALRKPKDLKELPNSYQSPPKEELFYCLLEDDALITGVALTTDRLLEFSSEDEVLLLIRVRIRGARTTIDNMSLIG
jgi:hypothetical protein